MDFFTTTIVSRPRRTQIVAGDRQSYHILPFHPKEPTYFKPHTPKQHEMTSQQPPTLDNREYNRKIIMVGGAAIIIYLFMKK